MALAGQFLGTHVISEGRALHLYDVRADRFIERSHATIPPAGTLAGHEIFNMVQHPLHPDWLFTTSLNECNSGVDWCWGNARIDLFQLTDTGIIHKKAVYRYEPGSGNTPTCATVDWGYPGQVGACAPVGMAFNNDGSRLYIQNDYNDDVDVFSMTPSGEATFLSAGANGSTNLHGLAFNPNGQYVYNGQSTFDISTDTAVSVFGGNTGNATQVLETAGIQLLLTTRSNQRVDMYGLANPAAPNLLSSRNLGGNSARDVAINQAKTQLVTLGRNSVSTLSWNGSFLSIQQQLTLTGPVTIENRGVAFAVDDSAAVAAWFVFGAGGAMTGGATLYGIAPDGNITQGPTVTFPAESRVVRELATN
jgi:hypothetical protein